MRARRRGARIYAEMVGHGLTCEAFHLTSPEPDGSAIAATMRRALADASVSADRIDHVNAHGTATPHNDRAEARGIRQVFGDRAGRLPVTSVKSMLGHTPGRRRRPRSRDYRADHLPRRDSADDQPHRYRSGVRRGRGRERGARGADHAARSRRRWPLAATTRRWSCGRFRPMLND